MIAAQSAQAAFAGEPARGQVRQRSVDQVGEHGLDDGVPAVGDVGSRSGLGAVGEERVVPPDREQLIEAGLVADPAHDQPGGHWLLGGGERGERGISATSASLISSPVSGSWTAPG